MENVGLLFGHLEYFMAIWYILCQLGMFPFLVCCIKGKSGNPALYT
jgi:hypothetical protein